MDRQREAIERVVAGKGYQLVDSVELVDVSGTAVLHAPETIALLERIARREIDVIVASEMSRIIRPDDLSTFSFLEACKRNGVILDCGGTLHDFASPEGYLAGGIQALLGGHERMQMLRKMMASKEKRRANGKHPGSWITLPLGIGYDRKKDKYIFTPELGRIIEAFRLMDEDRIRSLAEVGRRANIHPASVRTLLSNPVYKGVRVYDKMADPTRKIEKAHGRQGYRPKIARPKERVIRVRIFEAEDQPVSDERWERVQRILESTLRNHEVFVSERVVGNLATGVAHCGFCGLRMYAKTLLKTRADGSRSRGYYICRSHHETMTNRPGNFRCAQSWNRKEVIDELFTEFVEKFLADPEFTSSVLRQARAKQGEKIVSISVGEPIQAKLDELAKRDERILAALEAGALAIGEAKQRRERIAEERATLLKSIGGSSHPGRAVEQESGPWSLLEDRGKWMASASVRERKAFIARLFSEIYLRGDSVSAFRLAPTLVASNDPVWGFAATFPVALDPPFRLPSGDPSAAELPAGHRFCRGCNQAKPESGFYDPKRSRCKECSREACRQRHRKSRGK
ncbi:hypothetical protein llg_11080 [Luteolibacter sp. LG18]|nr:hypothetical protein llg_11080 [Luteolibacter sp. LG18]